MDILIPIVSSGSMREKGKKTQAKKVWKPKESVKCLLTHVSLRGSSREDQYFDSVCSQHMIGDGSRRKIKGIGKLGCPSFPIPNEVLLVEGLVANLINISQLCDLGLKVEFYKTKCNVTNNDHKVIMKGSMSK